MELIIMNMYVNICPESNEKKDTLTLDLPPELSEEFTQMVHMLSDQRNVSARKAFGDLVRGTYYNLMEGQGYVSKSRKNAKRRGRNS